MARPKGKMFALLAVFVAIGLVAATGAFTSVDAQRTVSVNVSEDSDALLQLTPSSSANGQYASQTGDTVEINIADATDVDGDGQGLNDNATTEILYTVNVTNQGTQDVGLGGSIDIPGSVDGVDMYVLANDGTTNLSSGDTVTLGTGDEASIGLKIVTDDAGSSTNFDATLTLTADEADS